MEEKKKKVKENIKGEIENKEKKNVAEASCQEEKCPFHGSLKTRGRKFEGIVIKKFEKRIVVQFERVVYVRKYERYIKARTKIHARLPQCLKKEINVGDYVLIEECRPLSKIIHFVVTKKIKSKEEGR